MIGAVIGAAVSAGPQMIRNVREGQPLTTNIDPGEVAKAAAVGAVGGAIAGATFGVALAAAPAVGLGTGLGAHVAAGAASGVVAGQASRATGNALEGRRITEGLGNPGEMARDAVIGGACGAIGYGIERIASGVAVSRQAAIDDIVQTEFQNVRLTQYPKYDPGMPLNQYGEAAYGSYTKVGASAINGGRGETLITIAHEEMHHRLWARGWPQSESYVERVAQRFARLKGW